MPRILFAASIVLAGAACRADLPYTAPTSVAFAEFDPLASKVPLPNDLVFLGDINSVCGTTAIARDTGQAACAQAELLELFAGKFPSDQEVAVTIDFTQVNFDADGNTSHVAPDLDLSTFTPSTFFVFGITASDQGEPPLDPIQAGDYVKYADHGTLTLHHQGREPWAPGTYAVFIRGGDEGVRTTDGIAIGPSEVFALVAQGLDMTDPKNLGLLKAQTGSTSAAIAQGEQLNQLIGLYKDSVYPIVDTRFPHQQLAILTTFKIAPLVTNVSIDPARGLAPLPIDLLRDPNTGNLSALAACTLAGSKLAADGTCPSPAAAGFQALDGFSTTGAILGPTSDLIAARTIDPSTLMLFDLSDRAHPVQVDPAGLILEPCEFTSGCGSPTALSPVIGIQPAGATAGDPSSVFRTRPLSDDTDYAVVMTTGIKDKAGNSIGPGTVASIVRFRNPLAIAGHSALRGIDDTTAMALENMRLQLQPVFATLADTGIDQRQVAMAYTFHTQSITKPAVQLAALPYSPDIPAQTALPIPATFAALTPAAAFTKYGVDPAVVPSSHIAEILEADIVTFNALDPITGAFLPDPRGAAPEVIHVLIATPVVSNPSVPACTGALAPFGRCAPMMIFHHAWMRGRADMLTVADSYAAAGMVTVAIDTAKHGDRSFCTSGTSGLTSGCVGGATCVTSLPIGAQGDEHPPGTCEGVGFAKHPVSATCTGACAAAATDGIPFVSGNYLFMTTNFFRTRDSLRQDLIDQSQLVRAIAFVPSGLPPTGHAVFDHMVTHGLIIDPAKIYYSGQSLGADQGAANVASNPRISKAAFNVGGGTLVDVLMNAPAFADATDKILEGLGIQRGTADYLKLLVVTKTVLDPADPINFVGHLTANTLPNLLAGGVPQAPKSILSQMAYCDQLVPNPFSLLYASNARTGPLPTGPSFFAPGATGTFQLFVTAPFDPATFGSPSCSASAVDHYFLTTWATPSLTANAQQDIASFVMFGTRPLSVQHQ
ncbi:MAG TPA: hypothetical protein VIV40_33805 [Kofleriaceae bacterium]